MIAIDEACAGRPVSWLALERHALGELDAARADDVARHLDGCTASRAAYRSIDADRGRALPPLPDLWLVAARRRRRSLRAGSAAILAAAAALVLFWRDRGGDGGEPLAEVKGGAVSLSLVRERSGDVVHDPDDFRPGDRFKALVTCAERAPVTVELTVLQGAAVDRPLPPVAIRCGNRVPLPGAFRITGSEPLSVCVAIGDAIDCRDLAAE